MIEVERLDHVSIVVTDLTRAREFYGGVLGLTEVPRPPFDFEGAWYGVGDGQLHLIVHPESRTRRGTQDIDSRDGHYALRVRSHHQALQHLQEHGIACSERLRYRMPWSQIFLTDPDGNVIELTAEIF